MIPASAGLETPSPAAAHPESLLLRNVRLPGSDVLHEVQLTQGRIASLAATDSTATDSLDAEGRFLIPGLWDHHVHFTQWAIARRRLDLAATTSAAEVLQLVRGALSAAASQGAGAGVVGYGFRDGLWPDLPSLSSLDQATGSVPVGLISGDLHCMWLNSALQTRLGVSTDASGLLREADSFAVMDQLQDPASLTPEIYRQTAQAAAERGVVGIVEFENADNISAWPLRTAAGVDSLRVQVSVWPDRLQSALLAGISTGDVLDERGLVTMGPLKVISDGSLNTRTAWCWDPYPEVDLMHPHSCGMQTVPMDELQEVMRQARDGGISAAIHAIGDRANTAVLDAFEALAMPGVIEHAQLLRWEDIPRFARLGLTAGVQPEHAMDDRDVADAYWAGRTDRAFPLDALTRAGVPLRLGSDAPVSPLDPWVAIAAAVSRSRDGRDPWHPEQRLDPATALAAATRGGTATGGHQVRAGDAADLVLVESDPLAGEGSGLREMGVAATLLGGRLTYDGIS
ncbi:amidohydrolase [Nesterenkonia jeotgali]|uniref:Putative amidohydrolase YtcJ n=1 Tax=Nesterenkonia jeotgali TaxID=317018 RepID=A0A839FQ97_9MICC|nr:amidohydrolase family protein [Nesterenkonia jeotgali]MBA8921709.1 putative amidohydrolase YtcJ [Nesterenkonia jeotgali]